MALAGKCERVALDNHPSSSEVNTDPESNKFSFLAPCSGAAVH